LDDCFSELFFCKESFDWINGVDWDSCEGDSVAKFGLSSPEWDKFAFPKNKST
jgi:hypothetical protein